MTRVTVSWESECMTDWQPIETAPKDGGVKIGWADGVSFHMLWCNAKRFKSQFPTCAETETGGWVAFAYGLICYTGSGLLIIVKPTHWMPLPQPPEGE